MRPRETITLRILANEADYVDASTVPASSRRVYDYIEAA